MLYKWAKLTLTMYLNFMAQKVGSFSHISDINSFSVFFIYFICPFIYFYIYKRKDVILCLKFLLYSFNVDLIILSVILVTYTWKVGLLKNKYDIDNICFKLNR